MTSTQLSQIAMSYLVMLGPYLLIFFAIAFAHKVIDLIFYSIDVSKKRRY